MTHAGVATTPSVLLAIDDGFTSSDPFASRSPLLTGGTGDFTDLGPSDHGSNFDFGFGELKAGEAFSFDIFYGAAANETGALSALGLVGAELYSLGQSNLFDGSVNNDGTTFIFAFRGVGGSVIVPTPEVPLPAAGLLLIAGLGSLGALRARRTTR